ncbi:MAG: integrating conjugative element protein [Gammaproteobacteria bacterium]|nr:integrating conjugative element protein [Gammaproteobacteria bacterium]MBY0544828.1 integrating conjugative element protein [Gammaproteobacteria bacterium]
MKTTSKILVTPLVIGLSVLSHSMYAADGLIPAVQSGLYYEMNGGNDIPLPAFYDTSYLPLDADGDVGLGFDCGAFNPVASIQNSLNDIKDSAMNVEQQVLSNATGAVTEFPLYELSRVDPNLYNLITSAMAGAKEDVALSTKSCEVMQSEIGAGDDPYSHWGQLSLGNRWKQDIGSAELSNNGDINQARQDVANDAGKSGVPWVNPDTSSTQTQYAGGQNQPPIHVVHDTAMSGYNVIANDSSSLHSSLRSSDSPSELSTVFPTAKDAADWITNIVGDETITTYNGGEKSSQPATGLYSDIQAQTQLILPQLQALVTGQTPLSDMQAFQDLSSSGMAISPDVIRAIQQQQSPVIQSIITSKLAQNIAAMQVINKARLAMSILQSGSQIPAIYSNKAAQKNIEHSIQLLQSDIQNILMFVKAQQVLMSNTLTTVVEAGQAQQSQNTAVSVPAASGAMIENGAVQSASAS